MGDYVTLDEARAEGITEAMAEDDVLLAKIARASARIDKLTGQWFEPRELTLLVDGESSRRLGLSVPIIDVAEIVADDEVVLLEDVAVYNRHMTGQVGGEDDRTDPHIDFRNGRRWPAGRQNISVEGTFGYTDPPGPPGTTPPDISRACLLLVVQDLPALGDPDERLENLLRLRLISEKTRDQSQAYGTPRTGGARGYLTGNEEIDQLLEHYMGPLAIGSY